MSLERKPELHLEIAHVLFIDVVGFSKLLINDQTEILDLLNQIVRKTPHFAKAEAAGKLIRLATGDGMALVFSNSAEAPVECALEISEALKTHPQSSGPTIRLPWLVALSPFSYKTPATATLKG